jgi:hypothetical protein
VGLTQQVDSLNVHLNYLHEQPAPSLLAAQAECYVPPRFRAEWRQSEGPSLCVHTVVAWGDATSKALDDLMPSGLSCGSDPCVYCFCEFTSFFPFSTGLSSLFAFFECNHRQDVTLWPTL